MAQRQHYAANVLQPMLDAATPGGGVYLNEANYKQQNWQQEFYGPNYQKLLGIKGSTTRRACSGATPPSAARPGPRISADVSCKA